MSASERILIIDDENILRAFLRTLLENLGYQILGASNGNEGLEICAMDKPDLILLDISLPGLDGFQVCERLKADSKTKDIPVVFLSASLDSDEKRRAFRAGGVDYITKPFQPDEVGVRVRTQLDLGQQKRQLEESHAEIQKALFDTGMMNKKLLAMNERLRESENIKSQFIANMRNEINDPLGSILGLAEEITHPSLPMERGRQLAQMIKTEAFGLDFRMRNIFCAAELEAGEASPTITIVDVGSILRDAMDSFAHFARAKSIRMDLSGLPELEPLLFNSDGNKLRIIAANLIANAIEFSHEGGKVGIHASIQDDTLILQVQDEGIGIRESDRTLIFERFRQLDTGSMRHHHGHGLGLSIVKSLVDFLGGSIDLESELDRGSRFTCSLPNLTLNEDSETSSLDGNLFFFGDGEEQ